MASVSVRDVAALAGVSVGTVSNVLNHPEKVGDATVDRVRQAIEKLGFVRFDAARQLRAGRSNAIGFLILDVANPFFTDLARSAEDKAAALGLSVIIGSSDEQEAREAKYLDLFEQQRLLGVLISPIGDVAARLRSLRARRISAVLVDRISSDTTFSSVSVDDVLGGELAARHLIESGRRKITFVGGPAGMRQPEDRLTGARRAVQAAKGVRIDVEPTSAFTVAEGRAAGERIVARPASERPDAVFAANDLIALGVLQALFAWDISAVPDRIALIGYDDIGFARAAAVPLSSIRQPTGAMGTTAVEILYEEAEDAATPSRHVVFQPELVVRESSRPPR